MFMKQLKITQHGRWENPRFVREKTANRSQYLDDTEFKATIIKNPNT